MSLAHNGLMNDLPSLPAVHPPINLSLYKNIPRHTFPLRWRCQLSSIRSFSDILVQNYCKSHP